MTTVIIKSTILEIIDFFAIDENIEKVKYATQIAIQLIHTVFM